MSDYFIDFHKLNYHPHWVSNFIDGYKSWDTAKNIYPLYVEISPSGSCNHRCGFCAVDYIGYKSRFLDEKIFTSRLSEMGKLGIKSIMFAGEGEPLLAKNIYGLSKAAVGAGINISFTSNGMPITDRFIQETLAITSWMKISLNAGTADTYASIHGTKKTDFNRVIKNLINCVEYKKNNKLSTTIGAQLLLLPENKDEIIKLASICKNDIGLDYLVIKPYSQHYSSNTTKYQGIDYSEYMDLKEEYEALSDDDLKLIFRVSTMHDSITGNKDRYPICLSTPFAWAYIMATGDVYTCSAYLENEDFCIGNIHENSFKEIWEGERRYNNFQLLKKLDINQCRVNCRMNKINKYLYDLSANKVKHVNFI